MTTPAEWEARNNSYLAAGLRWLRGRVAGEARGEAAGEAPGGAAGGERWWEDLAPGPPPALELLGDLFGLSRFERLTLLLCAAAELDPGGAAAAGPGGGGPGGGGQGGGGQPTFALALSLLPDPAWDALSPQGPLRYWRLVEVHQGAGQPLVTSALRADERIVNYVKGLNQLDERLAHLVRRVGDALGPLTPSQEPAVRDGLLAWTGAAPAGLPPLVGVLGPDPAVRRGLAWAMASRAGLVLYELAADRLAPPGPDQADVVRLWERETLLQPLALYVDLADAPGDEPVTGLLRDLTGAVLVGCREPVVVPARTLRLVDARRPTPGEQEELWARALASFAGADGGADPASGAGLAGRLSAEFDLSQAAIGEIARQAGEAGGTEAVWQACRAHARPRLEVLAKHQQTLAAWDDLVLPDEETTLLRHVVDQVRGRPVVLRSWGFGARAARGSGITALFAGQSGTGKSLAAEIIAGELGLALYRVDLSGVVSKYIGETERNLRRVFDAADEGGCMLLFDEADALFGRRSEVKDSHDRYANIEVNYLLQRMEDYRGVAILTTNQRQAIDHAFLRRLRFVVNFPFPSPRERALLWQRAFPAGTPAGNLDLGRLTRLAATGGMIRNIALNAAFCAAGREIPVTTALVLEMARAEFRKLRLPVSDADFLVPAEAAR